MEHSQIVKVHGVVVEITWDNNVLGMSLTIEQAPRLDQTLVHILGQVAWAEEPTKIATLAIACAQTRERVRQAVDYRAEEVPDIQVLYSGAHCCVYADVAAKVVHVRA